MGSPRFDLSPDAIEDLTSIAGNIALRSGDTRANGAIERIWRTLAAISYFPNAGRRRLDLDGEPFLFSSPPWIILYEPEPNLAGIHVLRIFDGRRDLSKIFSDYKRPRGKA